MGYKDGCKKVMVVLNFQPLVATLLIIWLASIFGDPEAHVLGCRFDEKNTMLPVSSTSALELFPDIGHPCDIKSLQYLQSVRGTVCNMRGWGCVFLCERRTKVPSLETCLASVKSPGNHAFSL